MNAHACIAILESSLVDPGDGLPLDVFHFVSRITPLINVDLLIKDVRGRTLLTWREDEFFGGGWHVPGGIIRYKETRADRIHACAREELGAVVSFEPVPVAISEFIREHRTRGQFISLLYRCRLESPPDAARRAADGPAHAGQWRWHEGVPPDLLEAHRVYARFL